MQKDSAQLLGLGQGHLSDQCAPVTQIYKNICNDDENAKEALASWEGPVLWRLPLVMGRFCRKDPRELGIGQPKAVTQTVTSGYQKGVLCLHNFAFAFVVCVVETLHWRGALLL